MLAQAHEAVARRVDRLPCFSGSWSRDREGSGFKVEYALGREGWGRERNVLWIVIAYVSYAV